MLNQSESMWSETQVVEVERSEWRREREDIPRVEQRGFGVHPVAGMEEGDGQCGELIRLGNRILL